MKHRAVAVVVLAIFLSVMFVGVSFGDVELNVKQFELKNGLKLLVVPRHFSPTVAVQVHYRVGGADDPPGLSGTAHFLEHMLFKGTKTIGSKDIRKELRLIKKRDEAYREILQERARGNEADKEKIAKLSAIFDDYLEQAKKLGHHDAIWRIYPRNGAVGINGSTSSFQTSYYCELPKNRLELWARVESDRMQNATLRHFHSERGVILEERLRGFTITGRYLYDLTKKYSFLLHPFGRPNVGYESDIKAITPDSMMKFYKTYYVPNNAVLVVVGDVDPQAVFAMVKKYFGKIPRGKTPPRTNVVEPPQNEQRRITVRLPSSPLVKIIYRVPDITHEDIPAIDAFADIIASGGTSRLYMKMVKNKHAANSVIAWSSFNPMDNMFIFHASPQYPHTCDEMEKMMFEEIAEIQKNGVNDHELQRVKNVYYAGFIRRLESNSSLAHTLGFYELFTGEWEFMFKYKEAYQKITREDVQRVARKYFSTKNYTVIVVQKDETAKIKGKSK